MKLQINENSLRFRISKQDLRKLLETGRIKASVILHSEGGSGVDGRFDYVIKVAKEGAWRVEFKQGGICLYLRPKDLETLADENEEGVYLRRESTSPSGEVRRFMAFVEIDKEKKDRVRPEDWIKAQSQA